MSGRGSLGRAARLRCAAALLPVAGTPAFGQTISPPPAAPQNPPDAAELDPSAPLAPLPDLGVDWPDLRVKDTAPTALPVEQAQSAVSLDEGCTSPGVL